MSDLAPTSRLRWLKTKKEKGSLMELQQWWAPNVPAYMIGTEGEWRRVEMVDAVSE